MKCILIDPYKSWVDIASTKAEYERAFKRFTGDACVVPYDVVGRAQELTDRRGNRRYLVLAKGPAVLAHELSHVIFMLFKHIGIDARKDNGEAFCYLLEHLMGEAAKK